MVRVVKKYHTNLPVFCQRTRNLTMVAIVIRNALVNLHGSLIGITCPTPTPSYTTETASEIASATMVIAAASGPRA